MIDQGLRGKLLRIRVSKQLQKGAVGIQNSVPVGLPDADKRILEQDAVSLLRMHKLGLDRFELRNTLAQLLELRRDLL